MWLVQNNKRSRRYRCSQLVHTNTTCQLHTNTLSDNLRVSTNTVLALLKVCYSYRKRERDGSPCQDFRGNSDTVPPVMPLPSPCWRRAHALILLGGGGAFVSDSWGQSIFFQKKRGQESQEKDTLNIEPPLLQFYGSS